MGGNSTPPPVGFQNIPHELPQNDGVNFVGFNLANEPNPITLNNLSSYYDKTKSETLSNLNKFTGLNRLSNQDKVNALINFFDKGGSSLPELKRSILSSLFSG